VPAKNFKELQAKMSPAARAKSEALAKADLAQMALDELREARKLTQAQLANTLKVDQGSVSKLERRTDMYVSTLRNFIRAMGGELHIRADFPDGSVEINQFEETPAQGQEGKKHGLVSHKPMTA
jgi:predicted XRE-type DNA-binding protein